MWLQPSYIYCFPVVSPVVVELLKDASVLHSLQDPRIRHGALYTSRVCLLVGSPCIAVLGVMADNTMAVTDLLHDPAVSPALVHMLNIITRMERENSS
jgi:hypothetical protein